MSDALHDDDDFDYEQATQITSEIRMTKTDTPRYTLTLEGDEGLVHLFPKSSSSTSTSKSIQLPVHHGEWSSDGVLQVRRIDFKPLPELDRGKISRDHCRIECREDAGAKEFWLVDTSSNGTALNGVIMGKGKEEKLNDNDSIGLIHQFPEGVKLSLMFAEVLPPPPSPPPPSAPRPPPSPPVTISKPSAPVPITVPISVPQKKKTAKAKKIPIIISPITSTTSTTTTSTKTDPLPKPPRKDTFTPALSAALQAMDAKVAKKRRMDEPMDPPVSPARHPAPPSPNTLDPTPPQKRASHISLRTSSDHLKTSTDALRTSTDSLNIKPHPTLPPSAPIVTQQPFAPVIKPTTPLVSKTAPLLHPLPHNKPPSPSPTISSPFNPTTNPTARKRVINDILDQDNTSFERRPPSPPPPRMPSPPRAFTMSFPSPSRLASPTHNTHISAPSPPGNHSPFNATSPAHITSPILTSSSSSVPSPEVTHNRQGKEKEKEKAANQCMKRMRFSLMGYSGDSFTDPKKRTLIDNLRAHGAQYVTPGGSVDLVVLNRLFFDAPSQFAGADMLGEYRRSLTVRFVSTSTWLEKCLEQQKILPLGSYEVLPIQAGGIVLVDPATCLTGDAAVLADLSKWIAKLHKDTAKWKVCIPLSFIRNLEAMRLSGDLSAKQRADSISRVLDGDLAPLVEVLQAPSPAATSSSSSSSEDDQLLAQCMEQQVRTAKSYRHTIVVTSKPMFSLRIKAAGMLPVTPRELNAFFARLVEKHRALWKNPASFWTKFGPPTSSSKISAARDAAV
eukprot:TRINITY_DN11837_c0_g1_i1.p1 TRINITY_DN11837_c0_g1~~TRINITY_DN11837_c0_g1_i1.p1  ORF type:complete len:787 (-),score=192.55 TRINITY_DN11837_c0_g1_i1:52-2412(-)